MMGDISKILRAGAGWYVLLIFPTLFAIPLLLPAAIGVLRFVLESLNSFGAAP